MKERLSVFSLGTITRILLNNMEVYFVRHGQTGGNIAHRHQNEASQLTPKGRDQAQATAAYVATLAPTHLYASDRVRAIQTASVIASKTDLIPETSALFSELCRPWQLTGHKHHSFRSMWYLLGWFLGRRGGRDCGEMGESYATFRVRIAAARKLLESLPADARVVIVSHSVFINLFVVHVCRPEALSLFAAFGVYKKILMVKNASVTHFTYTAGEKTCGWILQNFGHTPK